VWRGLSGFALDTEDEPAMLRAYFHRHILGRRWACFVVMGAAFFVFAAGTLNLASLLNANTHLVLDYGWQALMDGAARQLAELLVSAYLGMAGWLVFKACETRLVQWLTTQPGP
jgi:hypothetical protein